MLLTQFHFKYDFSILTKRYLFFYQSRQLTRRTWIFVYHQWKCFKQNSSKNIAEQILKKILLSNIIKLFETVRSEANERLLNVFNNAIAFIFNTDDYTVSICVCIKVLNILRYKINNTRPTLNELMLIITELKNVHEEDKNRICLKHWKKMIFLTSAILKSLSLFSFNKIIVNQEIWIFSTMIQKNNKFFYKKIIKNYISIITERFVNAFNKFVKRIKQIDITIFDINVYWNVMSNNSIALSSIFKSFIFISNFVTFRSFKKFDVDIRMWSQNVERFKRIVQQIFKKLNLERFRIDSSSNQFMKN